MALQFRRGKEEMVQKSDGGGEFRPFIPTAFWKDGDTRYLWVLNPADDIPRVSMQKVWTREGRSEYVVARTDQAVGESVDPIELTWGYAPQDLNICIAVELDPRVEVRNGRERPTGFEVRTRTFERRIRDASGNLTEDREEVTVPAIVMVAQSPSNFFNHVASQDATVGPLHELPMSATRNGAKTDTDYEIALFDEKPLDKDGFFENWMNVNYLSAEDIAEIEALVGEDGEPVTEEELAMEIGGSILDKRLNEMADLEYYNEILGGIDQVARYPSKKFKGAKAAEEETKPERPARRSQRRSKASAASSSEETPSVRPEVSRNSPVRERMEELKKKTAARSADGAESE